MNVSLMFGVSSSCDGSANTLLGVTKVGSLLDRYLSSHFGVDYDGWNLGPERGATWRQYWFMWRSKSIHYSGIRAQRYLPHRSAGLPTLQVRCPTLALSGTGTCSNESTKGHLVGSLEKQRGSCSRSTKRRSLPQRGLCSRRSIRCQRMRG